MSWDTVVNVAQGAWQVLKDGQPSAEIASSTANAVPAVDDWQTIAGASSATISWPIRRSNAYGIVVVDIGLMLKFEYGATYRGGGAFIPNIYIEVKPCEVLWPQNVDLRLTARNPTNAGTAQAPIARIPVTVSGTITNWFQVSHVDYGFTLFGDGNVQQ